MPKRYRLNGVGALSVNSAYKRGRGKRLYMNPKHKQWMEEVSAKIAAMWAMDNKTTVPLHQRVTLYALFQFKSERKRDLDNCLKHFQDCLVKAKVLEDDSQVFTIATGKAIGHQEDCIEFAIETLEETYGSFDDEEQDQDLDPKSGDDLNDITDLTDISTPPSPTIFFFEPPPSSAKCADSFAPPVESKKIKEPSEYACAERSEKSNAICAPKKKTTKKETYTRKKK